MSNIDPVLARRASIARWTANGKRFGYSALLIAIAAFGIGIAGQFTEILVAVILMAMALSTIALVPSIIFAYGVKAANREDRRQASQ